ncbi:recombinase family protein [Pelosinus sp. sgz500959]|uniref:recombinase family protein n=1 Tax=Pelosinus sp. sgz500959 TaxID=3242472 RepID=UPI00366A88BA
MIAALYIRVSTADQAEKGYSLETQLAEIRQKAIEFGAVTFIEFIDDGYSGEYIDRPALTQLRDGLERKEFDIVVIYDPDRLARNLAHQLIITEEIEKSGAKLLFVSVTFEESPEGKLFYSMRGAISAYEKEKIKERTNRGKKGKARQGKLVNNGHCFGYDYSKADSMYMINEEQAAIVRQIFDLCIKDQLGTALISKKLNNECIPAPRGDRWIVSSIHRILTNTAYKGIVHSMKHKSTKTGFNTRTIETRPESEWIPIQVPAIVDEVTWHSAQKQLQANKDFAKRNLKYDHLLNGLIYCANCGRKMSIKHSGNIDHPVSYYVCLTQVSTSYMYLENEKCTVRRVPTVIVDELVWNKLCELAETPEIIAQYAQDIGNPIVTTKIKNTLLKLTETEKKISTQKETILRWFRQQVIDSNDAEKQLDEINKQLIDIEITKKTLKIELNFFVPRASPEDIAKNIKKHFKDTQYYEEDERKAAVRAVLEKVVVERVDRTYGRNSRPELTIDLKFL